MDGLVWNLNASIRSHRKGQVPGDFPQKPVRIRKVPRITAPEGFLGRLYNRCPSGFRFRKHRAYFFTLAGVISKRYSVKPLAVVGYICVLGELMPREQGKSHSTRLKKYDPFSFRHGLPPSKTLIERPTAIQVRHA